MPSTPLQTLAYAKEARVSRRWRRRTILLILLAAASGAAYGWRADAKRGYDYAVERYELLKWQRQCCRYTSPPDRVVFETDHDSAAVLLQGPEGYVSTLIPGPLANAWGWPNFWARPEWSGAVLPPPRCFAELQARHPTSPFAPGSVSAPHDVPSTIAFLHRMRSPNGRERLVYVTIRERMVVVNDATFSEWQIVAETAPIVGFLRGAHDDGTGISFLGGVDSALDHQGPAGWRFYAGQLDASDPARFTIDFEKNGVPGTIEGRLNPDHLGIEWRATGGPPAPDARSIQWHIP